jgi:hypothetical protein
MTRKKHTAKQVNLKEIFAEQQDFPIPGWLVLQQGLETRHRLQTSTVYFRSDSFAPSGVSVGLSKFRWYPSGSDSVMTHIPLPTCGSEQSIVREQISAYIASVSSQINQSDTPSPTFP